MLPFLDVFILYGGRHSSCQRNIDARQNPYALSRQFRRQKGNCDRRRRDSQTVAKATGSANLKANDFVTFGSASSLPPAVATPLTGGTNGTVNGAAHTAALNAFEVESFNVVGYPGTDEEIKSLYETFVKRLRADEGKKIVGVLHDYKGDNIGLINVKNGVVLNGGTTVTSDKTVAWVAGASAGAEITRA